VYRPVRIIDPFTEDGLLNLLHQPRLLEVVGDGVGRHVKEKKVLLLGGENPFLDKVLGQPLPNVLQLVPFKQRSGSSTATVGWFLVKHLQNTFYTP